MEHVDTKAIRERLNQLIFAIGQIEATALKPQLEVIHTAQRAIREIVALVADDEHEEHGEQPTPRENALRERIRAEEGIVTGDGAKE